MPRAYRHKIQAGPESRHHHKSNSETQVTKLLWMPCMSIGVAKLLRHSRVKEKQIASVIKTGIPAIPCGWMAAKMKPLSKAEKATLAQRAH